MTRIDTTQGFSAELWAAFWAAPDLSQLGDVLADDVVGYWPGDPEAVRGRPAYVGKLEELLAATPDLTIELIDSVTVDGTVAGEQVVYLYYVGRSTGPDGPFAIRGLDRVRTRDGVIVENVIRYDVDDAT